MRTAAIKAYKAAQRASRPTKGICIDTSVPVMVPVAEKKDAKE